MIDEPSKTTYDASDKAPQYPNLDENPVKSNDVVAVSDNNYDLKQAAHPHAAISTVIFKLLSILAYFFSNIFFDDVIQFILVVIFASADFWTVKNVTGRLLVGLRWWRDFKQDGSEIWRFESSSNQNYQPNRIDSSFFWSSQVIFTLIWGIFLVVNLFGLTVMKATLNCITFTLAGTNLYGYYKCSKEHQDKVQKMQQDMVANGMTYMFKKGLSMS